jgi:hypothetical protein
MRGDNIQEGHFMERSWARLMSTHLESYQTGALKQYSFYCIHLVTTTKRAIEGRRRLMER